MWQPLLADYVTNPDNSKLKSLESLSSLINCMIVQLEQMYPGYTDEEYVTIALNAAYLDRGRLGKAGHVLREDAMKAWKYAVMNNSFDMLKNSIIIPSVTPAEEKERCLQLRVAFRAKQAMRKAAKATAPPTEPDPLAEPEPEPQAEPQPEPEPSPGSDPEPQPEPQPEPEPQHQAEPEPQPAKTSHPQMSGFTKPTMPGYIIPPEYPLIRYSLASHLDILLEGDASAGKSLTIDVMCKTEGWNMVQMGKVVDETMLKGFMNPITKEFTPSKLVKALLRDPSVCPYPDAMTVIVFDEGFTNMADYLTVLLTLMGTPDGERGYLATEIGEIPRGNTVFVFIDNTTGDGGTTNYISRKPIDMALKSRLFEINMRLSPKIAKAICADDKELYEYVGWVRKSIERAKIDRLSLDNRGIRMIQTMKSWDQYSDEVLQDVLYGAFFKGCPPASMASLLRNISASPEELKANKYFMATQEYYKKLCKRAGLQTDPACIKA